MKPGKFKTQAAVLYNWVYGEPGRVFFVNDYLGYSLSTNGGKLIITEAEGRNHEGNVTEIDAEDIDLMEFDEDEFKFMITTKEDSEHGGQGYDIEVYDLERVYPE